MKASRQLNRSFVKLGGTALLSIIILASGAFILTSDATTSYGAEVSIQAMKQRAMLDISLMLFLASIVGVIILNLKSTDNGNT